MKLRFTPRATQDLAAIADYIVARNPDAAPRGNHGHDEGLALNGGGGPVLIEAFLRARARGGRSLAYRVPEAVSAYIRRHRLYVGDER